MVDYFTRYLVAKAIVSATGASAKSLFESVTETFVNPLSVYTENGAHYTGDDIHGTLTERRIKHFPPPKSHPSSVGLVERYVQLLMGILKRRVQTDSKNIWDKLIPRAVHTLNTRRVKVHGFTAYELLLGYNPCAGPIDNINAHIVLDGIGEATHGMWQAMLDENRELAREQIVAMAQEREAREQEKEKIGVYLKEGDLVLVRLFEVAKHHGLKLECQWEGPYRLADISYHQRSGRLQDLETGDVVQIWQGGLREWVHIKDLKL